MSRVRSWLADPVAAGLTAGALLALVEVARLGALTRPGLALTVIALAAVAGTFTGAAGAAAAAVADRLRARGVARAAILAAPALAITIPVGGSLFEGAFAATLPGARWAPIAVPALGWLGLAAAIAIGQRLVAAGPRARGLVVAALALGGLVVEAANRARCSARATHAAPGAGVRGDRGDRPRSPGATASTARRPARRSRWWRWWSRWPGCATPTIARGSRPAAIKRGTWRGRRALSAPATAPRRSSAAATDDGARTSEPPTCRATAGTRRRAVPPAPVVDAGARGVWRAGARRRGDAAGQAAKATC
jgi:hypothetical protein